MEGGATSIPLQGWILSGPRESILIARSRALDLDNDLVELLGPWLRRCLASRKSVAGRSEQIWLDLANFGVKLAANDVDRSALVGGNKLPFHDNKR